jgi:hypothetical protein
MASPLESFSKWLQLKLYQFEVTLSVYMYTPVEKFIFCMPCPFPTSPHVLILTTPPGTDSVLFLLFSLTFIASVLYLPEHVQFIISRAWFYMHGDSCESAAELVKDGVGQVLSSVAATTAAATAEAVKEL